MMNVDIGLLKKFEDQLNPSYPDQSGIPPRILGYGEISTTFSIEDMPGVAFKRMPPFDTMEEINTYKSVVERYCALLKDGCGIDVSEYAFFEMTNRFNELILYVAQPRLPETSIGNYILKHGTARELEIMIEAVMARLIRIRQRNRAHAPDELIAIDGQISNWSFQFTDENPCRPVYFDITTPLFRVGGKEQLDTEIFLKSCPSFLVWLVRWQFLQEVLDRYYDLRMVLIDLVANFHKEGRGDMIEPALLVINRLLKKRGVADDIHALARQEVDKYYKKDAFIWSLFLRLRRFDRLLKTRALGKRYNFILPGKIKR
jgi:hypothetical protein